LQAELNEDIAISVMVYKPVSGNVKTGLTSFEVSAGFPVPKSHKNEFPL
jgi:hypothetical protein